MKMLRMMWVVMLFAATGVSFGQAKPADVPAPKPAAIAPKLTDASHARIRDVQFKQAQLEARFSQLREQAAQLQAEYATTAKELNDSLDAAFKESGLKKEEWDLNLATLALTAVPAKPAEAPKNPVSSPAGPLQPKP